MGVCTPILTYFCLSLVIWSTYPTYTEAIMLGSSLSSSLPSPVFPVFPPLFPLLDFTSGLSLPLPSTPLSPAILFLTSLLAAPPYLALLIVRGVVCPRLPFTSTIWTLILPLLMTSAYIILWEVLLFIGWCDFFPHL
jgi:hypothetical protein